MTGWRDLDVFAVRLVQDAGATETDLRRAISALYYCLFDRLAAAGATRFAAGGQDLQNQVGRAYSHGTMRKVCGQYFRPIGKPFSSPLLPLNDPAPDARPSDVAEAFVVLQEARHAADYDLRATFTNDDAYDLWGKAQRAHRSFGAVERQPATLVFLTALLLGDLWTRRG